MPLMSTRSLLACVVGLALLSSVEAQQQPQPAQQPDAGVQGRAVVNDLVAGRTQAVAARFSTDMSDALPEDKLAALWKQIVAQVGAFQRIESVRTQPMPGGRQLAEVTCTFEKAPILVRVVFGIDQRISGLAFAPLPSTAPWTTPAYVNERQLEEREVVVGGALKLPAALTAPRTKGTYPGVVLVHGSGPHDRDETIGGAKVFKDLAWGLASRGIVVLRYDKRTRVQPEIAAKPFTVNDEVIEDVRQAVTTLLQSPLVDRRRVFVVGHSLGATLAPRIAVVEPRLAGIVMLAAAARPLEDVALDQVRYLTFNDASSVSQAEAMVRQVRDPALAPGDVVDFLGSRLPGAYFLDLRDYEPTAVARSLKKPIFIAQGGRDYQVTDVEFDLWTKALSDLPNVTLRRYPALNHLLQAGEGQSSRPEEYALPNHVADELIADVASWIVGVKN